MTSIVIAKLLTIQPQKRSNSHFGDNVYPYRFRNDRIYSVFQQSELVL